MNVRLLRWLGTAQQQDDKFCATTGKIDPIARAKMEPRLEHPAPDCLAVTQVAFGHSLNGHDHTGLGADIRQIKQALPKRTGVDYLQVAPY